MSAQAARRTRQPLGTCKATGKLCFLSERSADLTLGRLRSDRRRRGHMESRAYECDHCDRWHLTSWSTADEAPTPAAVAHTAAAMTLSQMLAADLAVEVEKALEAQVPLRIPSPGELASRASAQSPLRRGDLVPA